MSCPKTSGAEMPILVPIITGVGTNWSTALLHNTSRDQTSVLWTAKVELSENSGLFQSGLCQSQPVLLCKDSVKMQTKTGWEWQKPLWNSPEFSDNSTLAVQRTDVCYGMSQIISKFNNRSAIIKKIFFKKCHQDTECQMYSQMYFNFHKTCFNLNTF